MSKRRPIDRIRDASGQADIGTQDDGGIMEMKNIGGRLIVIKEKSIYELKFADDVDPERTNIGLPQTIQKLIIDKGAESEIVARTLLTAKTIFKSEYIKANVDCNIILGLVIDMLSEFFALEKEISHYLKLEEGGLELTKNMHKSMSSFTLPSVPGLDTKCKTIFQKADHIEQILMEIVVRFYPNQGLTRQSHFPKLHEVLVAKYGEEDEFSKYIHTTLDLMKVVREFRNGFDHRLDTVEVTDFDLKPDGGITSPTIQLKSTRATLEVVPLGEFLVFMNKNLISIIEVTFAYLGAKNRKTMGFQPEIKEIPEDKRLHPLVRFSFWIPIGKDGFYDQK